MKTQLHGCVLVGDRGYLSRQYQQDLFDATAIRIETLFSQLCDQFMIRRNDAKSLQGLLARMLSNLTALTLIQWLNIRNGIRLNNIKIVIA